MKTWSFSKLLVVPRLYRPWMATTAFLLFGLAACTGSTGPAGTSAVDTGSITGTVTDAIGSPVAAATVSTDPLTVSAQTDASGAFTLASIPIGSYNLIASKSGYVDGKLTGVGVGAKGSVRVSLVLAPAPPTVGTLSGIISGRTGTSGVSSPLSGAQVCVEGTSACTTSQSDGSYTLTGITPGYIFLSATATGFLPGETRLATVLASGATVTGLDITLSGRPRSTATYIGNAQCVACHPDIAAAWQSSAHAKATDRTLGSVDWIGWPAEPVSCGTPTTVDLGFTATDPADSATREVYLMRWRVTGCTPPKIAFAMAFNTNGNATVGDAGDTIIPVNGSVGGVATGAGQCGNTGIIPANAPCSANPGGSGATAAMGWWQQEYLVNIGGTSKPSWVTWPSTTADMLVLPATWNQRSKTWIPAPDYDPVQSMSWSVACSGCHETGLSLVTDASGTVTTYSAVSESIGCEKCHGPGSDHANANGESKFIVNPAYLTAKSEREVCGQCHSQDVASISPAGVYGFAWNDSLTAPGGGNFIPGVYSLSDFQSAPAYGDPADYWPNDFLFPSTDHITSIDLEGNVHVNNPFEKLTCANCHSGHGGTGGPVTFRRTDPQTKNQYVFQNNDATLRNNVICLACHAAQTDFASISLEDVANYHISAGGLVTKITATQTIILNPSVDQQAQSTGLISSLDNSHMMTLAAMPAYFDPTGAVSGMPVGRCSSCHMAKTSFTALFFSGPDANGKTANVMGDVTSHVFRVAWPSMSLETVPSASTWDGVMPNSCGSCHAVYRFGK